MSDESNNSSYHDGIFLPFVDEEEEEEDEDNVVMGSGRGRNRRSEDRNDVGRNVDRPGPPNTRFNDVNSDGYFVDGDDRYFKYDENDRWRGRDMDPRRSEPPMQSGGYNVRPLPPQSRGQQPPETDDDYYFLQFGSQLGRDRDRDRDRGRDRYYDDEDDYEGPQPSAPCPAFVDFDKDEKPKGPPSSFGNFVANASMSKTGYAPVDMGEEMSSSTGNMLSPKGLNGGRRDPSRGRSPQADFEVSEDQDDSDRGRGRKKGPPSSFGKSVAGAGEQQTGNPTRNIEEEIANGGMATPTGGMASPKMRAPANPAAGGESPAAPSGGARQGAGNKALFVVSDEDAGPADFGSTVAEASGSRTGWAPKTPKRATGSIDGGTTGGMRPKVNRPSNPGSSAQKQEFGSSIFDDCPPLESTNKRQPKANPPLQRKQSLDPDMNQKHERNPAVNLIDGGASKNPPKPVQFSGSMMAPRIRRQAPSAETEEDDPEDKEGTK